MRWINTLERRLGHLAFPGLIRIIVGFNILVFLLLTMKPEFLSMLDLRADRIMAGEFWRLITYVFIPAVKPHGELSIVWMFFYLNFLWMIGEGLEQAWGSFKLNCFYLVGMLCTTIAALCLGLPDTTGVFLNFSLLFAFATLFPDFPILLFFVLPLRVKWIALASLIWVLMMALDGENAMRLAIVVSLGNYLLFFSSVWVRQWREQGKIAERQKEFQLAVQPDEEDETLHRCKVCGRTELTSADLEFRVARDGEEYCLAHLPSRQAETPPPLPS